MKRGITISALIGAVLLPAPALSANASTHAAPAPRPAQQTLNCVELLGWSNTANSRWVTVRNHCPTKQCYYVDQDWKQDSFLSVAGHATETDRYSPAWLPQGKGIYPAKSCTG
ncbi:hypothetical protein ACFVH6_09520 [Spirillospora sp. NPDC127200]